MILVSILWSQYRGVFGRGDTVSQLSLIRPGAGQGGKEFERRLQVLTRPLALPGRCQTFLVSDTGAGYWPLIGPAGSRDLDTEL